MTRHAVFSGVLTFSSFSRCLTGQWENNDRSDMSRDILFYLINNDASTDPVLFMPGLAVSNLHFPLTKSIPTNRSIIDHCTAFSPKKKKNSNMDPARDLYPTFDTEPLPVYRPPGTGSNSNINSDTPTSLENTSDGSSAAATGGTTTTGAIATQIALPYSTYPC